MTFLSNTVFPVTVSLALHALVFALLVVGWEKTAQAPHVVVPKYIEAKLVKLETKSKKVASAEKKPKVVDLTAKRKEQERLAREREQQRQQQIKRDQAAAEQKKREQQRKAEQEVERKAREQELARQRAQQEFDQALHEEEGMLADEALAVDAQSYTSRIQQRVEQNWSRPPSARNGMKCLLDIQLVPTGRIVSVTVIEGSGNAAFDRSAVQAVKKVEVFPEVQEMTSEVFERYYRRFRFLFNPQDLRL